MNKSKTISVGNTQKFTKQQLLQSEKFFDRKDAVNALLEEDKEYSADEAQKLIDDFMKGQVK